MTTKEDKVSTLVSRISVSLPPDLLAELDGMVESRGYGSRSQAIGEMVNYQLAEHKRSLGNEVMAGTLTLLYNRAARGLHGASEVAAFRDLPPFAPQQAAHLARLVLMQILPALAEADLEPFGRGLSELQRAIGDHFAPAQGGRFTSRRVAAALAVLEARGACCVGQSSWGPTGFAIVDTAERAQEHARELRQRFPDEAELEFRVVAASNRGARIRIQEPALGMPQGAG